MPSRKVKSRKSVYYSLFRDNKRADAYRRACCWLLVETKGVELRVPSTMLESFDEHLVAIVKIAHKREENAFVGL